MARTIDNLDCCTQRALAPTAAWTPLLALALSATAAAHHSISGMYDDAKQVTFEGAVTEFRFVNPHPFLIVAVAASDTGEQLWQLEMDNRSELSAIGVTPTTFQSGDHVIVTGSMSRTEPRHVYLKRLDRTADGFRYEQVGTRPRITSSEEHVK